MATAVWPTTLPSRPLSSSIGWEPQDNKVSFQPDVGPSIDRRRSSAVAFEYSAKFPAITAAQVAIFETFHGTTLADGTLHYLWNRPEDAVSYKWKIESYQFTGLGAGWHELTATLNRLPGAAV